MALKEDGDKIKRTIIYDKGDYDKLINAANKNKEDGLKSLNSISKLVRESIRQYLEPTQFDVIMRYTMKELRNYFKTKEATLIAATLKDSIYDINLISPKIFLLSKISDSIEIEKFDQVYGVDGTKFMEKLTNLSEFQCYIVIKMSSDFWKASLDPENDLDNTLKQTFLID